MRSSIGVVLLSIGAATAVVSAPEPSVEADITVAASQIRVVDGDTIRFGRERIRIIGLDAPESGNLAKCDAERQLSALATMTFREMIEGKFIEIRRDGHDRYGRTLAHVSIQGGGNVAELMIRQRLAVRFGNGRPDWCSGLAQRALQR